MSALRRKLVVGGLSLSLFWLCSPAGGQNKADDGQAKEKKPKIAAGAVEMRLADDSTLKLILRDERIELETAYGKLLIPVADIQRIDVGLRVSDELRKKIDTAISDLGSGDFRRRQSASTELVAWREKAYPALLKAAKAGDPEREHRIKEVLEKIREAVPEDVLDIPALDVVYTADSKIAGRIKADVLRVGTLAFGDQQIKLTDIRSVRTQAAREPEGRADANVLDVASFQLVMNQVGKTFTFRITGPPAGVGMQMGVFGTDVYTTDSSLPAAAVHAGAVQPGKTALVRVTMVGMHPGFQPSVRNGIASQPWGPWSGFRIEVPQGGGGRK